MSTSERKKNRSDEFVRRFVAMCGTANPRVISEQLDISYQSAKNYLNGRLPESRVLLRIADKTGISIHWLLTGEGDKFISDSETSESELLANTLSEIAEPRILRKIFEVLSEERVSAEIEKFYESGDTSPKKIKIRADRIRKERQSVEKTLPAKKEDR